MSQSLAISAASTRFGVGIKRGVRPSSCRTSLELSKRMMILIINENALHLKLLISLCRRDDFPGFLRTHQILPLLPSNMMVDTWTPGLTRKKWTESSQPYSGLTLPPSAVSQSNAWRRQHLIIVWDARLCVKDILRFPRSVLVQACSKQSTARVKLDFDLQRSGDCLLVPKPLYLLCCLLNNLISRPGRLGVYLILPSTYYTGRVGWKKPSNAEWDFQTWKCKKGLDAYRLV